MRVSPTLIALLAVSGAASGVGGLAPAQALPLPEAETAPEERDRLAVVADLENGTATSELSPTLPVAAQLAAPAPLPPMDEAAAVPDEPAIFASAEPPVAAVADLVEPASPPTEADVEPDVDPVAQLREQIADFNTTQAASAYDPQDLLSQSDSEPFRFPESAVSGVTVPEGSTPDAVPAEATAQAAPTATEAVGEVPALPPAVTAQADPTADSDGEDEGTPADTAAPSQPAQPPAEPRVLISEVQVQAPPGQTLEPFLEVEVYDAIRTRPGRTSTRTQIQQDINAIFATGFFADVTAQPEDTPLGVRVTFFVRPNPVLTFVTIEADSAAAITRSTTAADLGDDPDAPPQDAATDTNTPPDDPGNSVAVEGSLILPEAVVDDIFGNQIGQIINLIDFQDGILALNEWYQQEGYVLAQVVAAPRVSDQGEVTLDIAEGVIEDIQVRFVTQEGDTVNEDGEPIDGRTQDYIITREFATEPGDVFNQSRIERDFQNAFGLGIFEDIQLTLEPGSDNPRQVDLIVNVTEGSTGSIAAGLGFNFTGDLFGTLSYRQDNFGGNNQKLSAEVQLSTRDLLFDVSFTDPWIANDPFRTSYTANAFARRSINLNFDGGPTPINLANGDEVRIRRLGTGITFSRPLDNNWRLSLGTLYQSVSARDADGVVNPTDAAGNPLTASDSGVDDLWTFPFTAELDLRDDAFNPTSGSILRFTTEQSVPLGSGSIFMNRLRSSYSYYFPVSFLNFTEGPQALAINVQAGTIVGDVPPYEAFVLGGTNSIRGFDEGQVGSGRSYAQITAEYRFPLFSFLGGALFLDAGTDLGSGNSVPGAPGPSRGKPGSGYGYGAGLRVQTPLGPIRIDYGFGDSGQGRLHFGIGERF